MPDTDVFAAHEESEYALEKEKVPNGVVVRDECIVLNNGRLRVRLRVINTGDPPIQVCSTCPCS